MTGALDQIVRNARDAGLDYLAARARSIHEMRQHLLRKGYDAEVVQQTIADLERMRLLDDRDFARHWVESRLRSRPEGGTRIAHDLRGKGIAAEILEETLAAYAAQLDSPEMALGVLRKQRRRYAGLDESAARRRMLAFLARRGYGHDTASTAVDQAWEEWQRDEGK